MAHWGLLGQKKIKTFLGRLNRNSFVETMPDNEQNYPEHVAESSEYSNEYLCTIGVELGVKVESMSEAYKIQNDAELLLISKLYQYI